MESWRPIAWTDGRYEVSDVGRIRSWLIPGGSRRRRSVPRVLVQSPNNRGRLMVGICIDGKVSTRQVSRLVLEAFVGPCPDGLECCHENDDFLDNRIENLRWDSRKSNCEDAVRNGKRARGSRNGQSKLVESQVIELFLSRKNDNTPYRVLTKRYQVSEALVSNICTGKAWVWLTEDL